MTSIPLTTLTPDNIKCDSKSKCVDADFAGFAPDIFDHFGAQVINF